MVETSPDPCMLWSDLKFAHPHCTISSSFAEYSFSTATSLITKSSWNFVWSRQSSNIATLWTKFTVTKVDQDHQHHMASLGHKELIKHMYNDFRLTSAWNTVFIGHTILAMQSHPWACKCPIAFTYWWLNAKRHISSALVMELRLYCI